MLRKAVAALVGVSALVFPAAAFAHVIVSPGEVAAGSRVTFELRVPTEEPVPTTQVRLLIPEGVVVSGVEPVYGWRIKLEREGGRVVAISAKGSLPPDFFQRFFFRATVPDQETTLVWKAIQTYRAARSSAGPVSRALRKRRRRSSGPRRPAPGTDGRCDASSRASACSRWASSS